MAVSYRTSADGQTVVVHYYSVEDLRRDVRRYRRTPEEARKRIEGLRHLLACLLEPDLPDTRRVAIVNMLKRRLVHGHNQIEDLGALSKIATGEVDPDTLQYIEPDSLVLRQS